MHVMENIKFLFGGAELNTNSTHQNQEHKTNWNNKFDTLLPQFLGRKDVQSPSSRLHKCVQNSGT